MLDFGTALVSGLRKSSLLLLVVSVAGSNLMLEVSKFQESFFVLKFSIIVLDFVRATNN